MKREMDMVTGIGFITKCGHVFLPELWLFEGQTFTGMFADNMKITYNSFLSGSFSRRLSHQPSLKTVKDGG